MSKPVIYQFSIRFSRKDGKPISKRSKSHRACIELKERLIESGFEYVEVKPRGESRGHEERVIAEQVELLDKLNKLRDFIDSSPIFKKLPYDEQGRLKIQRFLMQEYSAVMLDRIDNFPNGEGR